MHEAGLAEAIAATIRQAGLLGGSVRILVRGGHDEPAAFDAALRSHLVANLPELDPAAVSIVHEPSEHWCVGCGRTFLAVWGGPCPDCGGPGLALEMEGSIDVERVGRAGPSDPPFGDRGPSAEAPGERHAGLMEGCGPGPVPGPLAQRPDGQVT